MKRLLLSLIFALGLSFPAIAQDQLFEISDFSGGLSTKLSEYDMPPKYGTVCENIRFGDEVKSLTKRNEILLYGTTSPSEAITGMTRLYLKDGTKVLLVTHADQLDKGDDDTGVFTKILDLSYSDRKFQWDTWHDLAIGTDGYNQPIKYDGTSAAATYLGSCLALDAGSGAGPDGVYTYKITFYTTSYEVSFNVPSNSITVSNSDIDLSMIPIGPDTFGGEDVIGRYVYRTGDGDSTYVLLSNGDIADNTSTTLTDSDADGERSGAYAPDYSYTVPKGRFPLIHKNRLWLANDPSHPSRIYYSEDGSHEYFLPTSYFDIRQNDGDQITFSKNLLGILTVGKNRSIQKIYTDGDDPSADWSISDPFTFYGCQAPYSAANTPLGIFYLSYDGIYNFNGQMSTIVSDIVTPTIQDIAPSNLTNCWGEFHRNTYYLTYASEATGATSNDRVLVFDTLTNAFSVDTISVNCFSTFSSGTDWDILYSGSSSDGKVYAHSQATRELTHSRHSDFTGTFNDMRYIPTRWGGDADNPILELAWTYTINEVTSLIDVMPGIIDRPDSDGSYTSQVLNLGANSYDKLYWNETIPPGGGDVTLAIRSGLSSSVCQSASWSSEYTVPSGSDISGETADDYIQYRASLTTTNIAQTPTLYKADNYVIKLTYEKMGSTTESSIPLLWKSGFLSMGTPANRKSLKKIQTVHEGTAGTLTIQVENEYGDTDTFDINLGTNPYRYEEYFTNGVFMGTWFKFTISEDSLNPLKIKKIFITYAVEPAV